MTPVGLQRQVEIFEGCGPGGCQGCKLFARGWGGGGARCLFRSPLLSCTGSSPSALFSHHTSRTRSVSKHGPGSRSTLSHEQTEEWLWIRSDPTGPRPLVSPTARASTSYKVSPDYMF